MMYRDRGLITITSKGRTFTKQYNELINLIESAALYEIEKDTLRSKLIWASRNFIPNFYIIYIR